MFDYLDTIDVPNLLIEVWDEYEFANAALLEEFGDIACEVDTHYDA